MLRQFQFAQSEFKSFPNATVSFSALILESSIRFHCTCLWFYFAQISIKFINICAVDALSVMACGA